MATLDSSMVTFLTQPSTFLSIEKEIFPRLLFWGRDFYKSSCLHCQVRCEVRKNTLQDILWSFSIFFSTLVSFTEKRRQDLYQKCLLRKIIARLVDNHRVELVY